MSFKDQLQADVAIFLNVDEFAQSQELGFAQDDGTYLMVELPLLTQDVETSLAHKFEPEIGLKNEVLYVPTSALPAGASYGTHILYKGETWALNKCVDNEGITSLELMMM